MDNYIISKGSKDEQYKLTLLSVSPLALQLCLGYCGNYQLLSDKQTSPCSAKVKHRTKVCLSSRTTAVHYNATDYIWNR